MKLTGGKPKYWGGGGNLSQNHMGHFPTVLITCPVIYEFLEKRLRAGREMSCVHGHTFTRVPWNSVAWGKQGKPLSNLCTSSRIAFCAMMLCFRS
jgi:hypothetical protein